MCALRRCDGVGDVFIYPSKCARRKAKYEKNFRRKSFSNYPNFSCSENFLKQMAFENVLFTSSLRAFERLRSLFRVSRPLNFRIQAKHLQLRHDDMEKMVKGRVNGKTALSHLKATAVARRRFTAES